MSSADPLDVAILRFPDLGEPQEHDALVADPAARTRWVERAVDLGLADLVVLPGSEKTLRDLEWMRATGLLDALRLALNRGAAALGICGGFQIMGTRLFDPERREGGGHEASGLGLFRLETTFAPEPVEEASIGTSTGVLLPRAARVAGRELHGGRSVLRGGAVPLFVEAAKGGGSCPLGVATADLGVIGTYLHDVLLDDAFRAAVVRVARLRRERRRAGGPQAPDGDPAAASGPPSAT